MTIYCDESLARGRFYSHFYGGALIDSRYREEIEEALNKEKESQNLFKEIKWTYITENYEKKYISFIDKYFDFVELSKIKIRIMFTHNRYSAVGLEEYQLDNQYFLLYYQLIKHAFGLRYCEADNSNVVSLLLDDIPDTKEKFLEFRKYIGSLCDYPVFRRSNVIIPYEDIRAIKSHDHVILQGLDIILGSMQFRLNDKHRYIPEGQKRRGKRTKAKERVYKHINKRIRKIYPGFNIGISTGTPNGISDRWEHPYRHWLFIPTEHEIDRNRGKKHKR